jgi:hypothetical protein
MVELNTIQLLCLCLYYTIIGMCLQFKCNFIKNKKTNKVEVIVKK